MQRSDVGIGQSTTKIGVRLVGRGSVAETITDVATEGIIAAAAFPNTVVTTLLEIDVAASGVEAVEQGINILVVSGG
jgi:hypothetical protein